MELTAAHKQTAPVGAGGNIQRFSIFNNRVRKAFLHRFSAGQISRLAHKAEKFILSQLGFSLVGGHCGPVICVKHIGSFPQIVSVIAAPQIAPAPMNHHQAGRIDTDFITGTHNDRSSGHSCPIHNANQVHSFSGQFPEPVMNYHSYQRIAADAVHADGETFCPSQIV